MSTQAASPLARRIFAVSVAGQILLVLTGGLVRLTGSGLGCPTWPQCVPGSYTPVAHQAQSFHKYIEFGNRSLTFALGVVALACVVVAFAQRPRRRRLVGLAALQLLGIPAQAVVGGITVLTDLNPAAVACHFLVSMLLVVAAVMLYERSGEGDGPVRPLVRAEINLLGWGLIAVSGLVLVAGAVVTGTGPHAGDEKARRFGFDPKDVTFLHADLVFLLLGLAIALAVTLRVSDGPAVARARARGLLLVILGQGVIGYLQYFTKLPAAEVALHMVGACLVLVGAVRLRCALRTRDQLPPGAEAAVPEPQSRPRAGSSTTTSSA